METASSEGSGSRISSEYGKKVAFVRPFVQTSTPQTPNVINISPSNSQKYARKASVFDNLKSGLGRTFWFYNRVKSLSRKWFMHFFLSVVLFLYTTGGAVVFLTIEGQNEKKLITHDIQFEMNELLKDLKHKSIVIPKQFSRNEWIGEASRLLNNFEKKMTDAFDRHPLVVSNPNGKVWNIWNSIVYCATLYTTIGYGHLYPTTFTGRVLTIVYSVIGIPLFLIVLTDFGKLFTKAIKFIWSFIRRVYYTGSCRKARKTAHVKDILKGAQIVYEIATFRRNSIFPNSDEPTSAVTEESSHADMQTPALSNFEVDDEFNLPVSVALFILVTYILCGAVIYVGWEEWDFFSSFYFVFISMSTIGFGDYVPVKPACMIVSIIYLCFGLALMTMCINVVQDKLSDTFTTATTKIGATIGIDPSQENSASIIPEEVPEVHKVEVVDVN